MINAANGSTDANVVESSPDPSHDNPVVERVLSVVCEVMNIDETPAMSARIREDLHIGSMDAVTIILTLEQEFGVKIELEQADSLVTVSDIVAMVGMPE
jgi:acyl carrier protein